MCDLDWNDDHVKCPHCGCRMSDLYEFEFRWSEVITIDCWDCGEKFDLHERRTVEYAASKCEKEATEA